MMKHWEAEVREEVKRVMRKHGLRKETAEDLSKKLVRSATRVGELIRENVAEWLSRLQDRLVWLNTEEYATAVIRGLSLAFSYASIDFRTGGERDLLQKWADSTRGELGEIGFVKFLKEHFGVEARVDKTRGPLEKYLPRDISEIKKPGANWTKPRLRVSIKDTKFQGAWLELPGAQVQHSDVFVLVKSGVPITHMISFFKHISIIREKLFPLGREIGVLTKEAEKEIWDLIPEFEPPPVYIPGFVEKARLDLRVPIIAQCRLAGRKEKRRIEIYAGLGIFSEKAVRAHPKIKELDPEGKYPIHIVPIKDRPDGSFLASSGFLVKSKQDWLGLLEKI